MVTILRRSLDWGLNLQAEFLLVKSSEGRGVSVPKQITRKARSERCTANRGKLPILKIIYVDKSKRFTECWIEGEEKVFWNLESLTWKKVGDAGVEVLISGLVRSPWSQKLQPTPVFLPGKFHGQTSLKCWTWLSTHMCT